MELTEAVQRILRHARLIAVVVGVCLLIPVLVYLLNDDTYVASARMNFGPDATNTEEAAAMVDTAEAIVTSPGDVESALSELSVDRNPARIVDQISVESVGVSGVLVLSVADTDPDVATALANSLAEQLVASRRELLIGPLEERLAQLDDELAAVGEDIDTITSRSENGGTDIDTLRLQLDEALSRQSDIRDQRDSLSDTLDATPRPALLDPATAPGRPEPSGLKADLLVAGLLGLILGVALAAVIEALRPSIVSGDALARVLGAPVLGRVPNPSQRHANHGDHMVTLQLGLAATSARLDVVHLTSVGPAVDLARLAGRLEGAVPNLAVDVVGSDSEDPPRTGTRPHRNRQGLVVVAPEVLPRDALSEVEHLLVITQWPLVGIISYPSTLWAHYTRKDRAKTRSRGSLFRRRRRSQQPVASSESPARRQDSTPRRRIAQEVPATSGPEATS
jgi:capsular polysaccharide biosynthesis protein